MDIVAKAGARPALPNQKLYVEDEKSAKVENDS